MEVGFFAKVLLFPFLLFFPPPHLLLRSSREQRSSRRQAGGRAGPGWRVSPSLNASRSIGVSDELMSFHPPQCKGGHRQRSLSVQLGCGTTRCIPRVALVTRARANASTRTCWE